jgi:hypothetical protein
MSSPPVEEGEAFYTMSTDSHLPPPPPVSKPKAVEMSPAADVESVYYNHYTIQCTISGTIKFTIQFLANFFLKNVVVYQYIFRNVKSPHNTGKNMHSCGLNVLLDRC